MNFEELQEKNIEEIYELQIFNKTEFGNNIWSKSELLNLLKKPEFYSIIFIPNKKIIGFSLFFESNKTLDLYSIFVSPKSRNKGVASSMINNALIYSKTKSLEKITLEVNEKNTKAINFYTKNGFSDVGRRRNYYELSGVFYDAILMEIKI